MRKVCALLLVLSVSLVASASAAAATPLLAEEWKSRHRVVKDTDTGFGNIVGARYSKQIDFYRCEGCPAELGIFAPGVARQKRVKLKIKRGVVSGSFSCRYPCGGRLKACSYALSIRMRITKVTNFEGLPVALRVAGTETVRQRPCNKRLQTTVSRFKTRRLGMLESGPAELIAVPAANCNTRIQRFQAEADSAQFRERPGKAISYLWNFGDGSTSTEANPTHTYASNRVFRASVFIRLEDGSVAKGTTEADASDPDPCQLMAP